jgi:propionyl-CoA carboxylase alpha chain
MTSPRRIRKVLVANRGEIALRVMRTCREMGIPTVAVYSDADLRAPHVQFADEARRLGPAPSAESYLAMDRVIAAALDAGADAVHPGYGFLSENPVFAGRVADAGLTFIGPPAAAIRAMGDKTGARRLVREAGGPTVPGTPEAVSSAATAAEFARSAGYPVLIKAAAGGGGKGMRVVHEEASLARALESARSEARTAFGDDRVYLEKYLEAPRHVEFQILADAHGTVLHLGERECSIQRRHQKVVEESPSPVVDEDLRRRMGEAAVLAARSCGYVNAGTIEFLLDADRRFYFLEMNTRLQVEHPVTEMRTGLDLVEQQLRIAMGEPLGVTPERLQFRGHAIECRICAEDPAHGFLPSTGTILHLRPAQGPGVRDDRGVEAGGEVSMFYDPMIAKLVVWAPTRPAAIARMRRALGEYEILGVRTNIGFCRFVLEHPAFAAGDFDTHFVDREFRPELLPAPDGDAVRAAAVACAAADHSRRTSGGAPRPDRSGGPLWADQRWDAMRS